jgi:hypothetical protein
MFVASFAFIISLIYSVIFSLNPVEPSDKVDQLFGGFHRVLQLLPPLKLVIMI